MNLTSLVVEVNASEGNSGNNSDGSDTLSPSDAVFHVASRVISLLVFIIVGTIGCVAAFTWLWCQRRRKSRVNRLILHVTLADWLVIDVCCVSQFIWESIPEREWLAGEFMCRFIKFLQGFSMMASSAMLLVLAFDRHQAIRSPLRRHNPVWVTAAIGWGAAALLSLPQLFLFHMRDDDGISRCENQFRYKPKWHRQAYVTFVSLVVFFIPLLLLLFCYLSIFLKISRKANQQRLPQKPAKIVHQPDRKSDRVYLQSTPSTSIEKAKTKTLIMTIVIVAVFILCSTPYHVMEMIVTYITANVDPIWYGIFGSAAVANSVVNPYIFLIFNAKCTQKSSSGVRARTGSNTTRSTFFTRGSVNRGSPPVAYSRVELGKMPITASAMSDQN
ncbi:cephalotocin receptor 2 [Lingula anatina]|uniref:Cephalotocin receptor 2 n=1 Tax=Lingula anatina TaxID=7574 RepID=A0A1S3HUX2_LINAN|nr:cephalotocin receptor 2 [Lingula anatina]XP_013389347.1 cephalotocin receptor 2 [Lingula anatina]XP_013389348.1 cephalotocin receptor 2 [Lingula anatina]XP_013389349.1 cephalotocin receptor 2 [Lingula anatina]XP_013389350.1 cephalotocin receptor 2 [Lingula anatina]|eukprot:XP_013389346.1 cephalotocin receptor 2 [Lingula anatina]